MKDAGDSERALDFFIRSRELYPSPQNTINVALCLTELQRYDEALELTIRPRHPRRPARSR
jgi:hypothetical protein